MLGGGLVLAGCRSTGAVLSLCSLCVLLLAWRAVHNERRLALPERENA
ncbi:hypothetical protein M8494_20270 [Serratia ureilytica]